MERPCEECGKLFNNAPKVKRCSRACYGSYRSRVIRGDAHPTFKGRVPRRDGYVWVWRPGHPLAHADGYVAEHRLVLYDAGVVIPPGTHVHHANHDKSDNRLENLSALTPKQHSDFHMPPGTLITNQFGTFTLRRDRA